MSFGFGPFSCQTWPHDPFKRVRLEKWYTTHIKSTPETNYNGISWRFSLRPPILKPKILPSVLPGCISGESMKKHSPVPEGVDCGGYKRPLPAPKPNFSVGSWGEDGPLGSPKSAISGPGGSVFCRFPNLRKLKSRFECWSVSGRFRRKLGPGPFRTAAAKKRCVNQRKLARVTDYKAVSCTFAVRTPTLKCKIQA